MSRSTGPTSPGTTSSGTKCSLLRRRSGSPRFDGFTCRSRVSRSKVDLKVRFQSAPWVTSHSPKSSPTARDANATSTSLVSDVMPVLSFAAATSPSFSRALRRCVLSPPGRLLARAASSTKRGSGGHQRLRTGERFHGPAFGPGHCTVFHHSRHLDLPRHTRRGNLYDESIGAQDLHGTG